MHWKMSSSITDTDFFYSIPTLPGIYVIFFKKKGVKDKMYIGSTNNLYKRLKFHKLDNYARYSTTIKTKFGDFDNVIIKYKLIESKKEYKTHEAELIKRLSPDFNIHFNTQKRK